MPHDLHATLERSFGHTAFREGQEQVIETLLAGRSALALFPTGAGKSLCYQLPSLLMDGLTVVISPLIALMKDQVEVLQSRGIAAARLDSSLSAAEAAGVYDSIRTGTLKLLYIAPERLLSEQFVTRLTRARVAMMAVDEAHCISEWGHNFRPEYLRLAHVAKELGIRPVLALTATATPAVAADIRRAFAIDAADHVQNSFLRPNLSYRITPCSAGDRLGVLTSRLLERRETAIVYVTLQKTAEEVASHLIKSGLKALAYHAGLPDEQRHEAQDAFMGGRADTIVATIAFGMGIDKADIRGVYHYNLPKTLENYAQETGRAGRDGRPSVCELLACTDDRIVLDNFTYGDTPTPQAIRHLLDEILSQGASGTASRAGEFDISLYDLAQATDIRPLVIETVLTHLELAAVLRPLGSFYASYQFRLLQSEAAVLAGHTPDRQAFLKRLLHAGKRGTKWITLHPDEAVAALDEPRDRILKALTWLADAGHIELKPSGSRQRYRLEGDHATRDPEQLNQSLQELFAVRETRDLERLQGVLDFAAHRGCLTRRLLQYFGEASGDEAVAGCGTCTSCREGVPATAKSVGVAPREMPASAVPPISPEQAAAVRSLVAEGRPSLRTPRQLARCLCGLTSPATTRERLGRHAAFGVLARVPFAEVLAEAETLLKTGR
ncbi:MAG: RecQ family ATP-dependent DNA helicase [Planctomycetia bacterium]|nr:RecQ family ATP-dependent DNA helicase [Planctomycetia bacterium]